MPNLGPNREIQRVVFPGETPFVEIIYSEPQDRSQQVLGARSIAIDPALISEELNDVLETLSEMIDIGLVELRLRGND